MKRILLSLLFAAVAVAIQAQDAAGVLSLARRVNDYFIAQNTDFRQEETHKQSLDARRLL